MCGWEEKSCHRPNVRKLHPNLGLLNQDLLCNQALTEEILENVIFQTFFQNFQRFVFLFQEKRLTNGNCRKWYFIDSGQGIVEALYYWRALPVTICIHDVRSTDQNCHDVKNQPQPPVNSRLFPLKDVV